VASRTRGQAQPGTSTLVFHAVAGEVSTAAGHAVADEASTLLAHASVLEALTGQRGLCSDELTHAGETAAAVGQSEAQAVRSGFTESDAATAVAATATAPANAASRAARRRRPEVTELMERRATSGVMVALPGAVMIVIG
jgi:hypothetical protein